MQSSKSFGDGNHRLGDVANLRREIVQAKTGRRMAMVEVAVSVQQRRQHLGHPSTDARVL